MSLDEDIETSSVSMSLFGILENRKDSVSISEIWALMKESCVYLSSKIDSGQFVCHFDINDIQLDSNGNININFDTSKSNSSQSQNIVEIAVLSLAETMMFIIDRYTFIDSNELVYRYLSDLIDQMSSHHHQNNLNSLLSLSQHGEYHSSSDNFNDTDTHQVTTIQLLKLIEVDSDRQLNGPSVDILTNDLFSNKDMDEINSDFQDSFLSTDYSMITERDSDSDASICANKQQDTLSPGSYGNKAYLSLSQLWDYCLDPIINSDQECLILIYSLLREVSNMLLNEINMKKCLCLTNDNILLNDKGKVLFQFSDVHCLNCLENPSSMKYYDLKYINSIGWIIYEMISDDSLRICVSSHIVVMLQTMCNTQDLIINDILHFCRSQQAFHGSNPRIILAKMYLNWNQWWNKHLQSLLRLKHRFLYDIAACHPTNNIVTRLRHCNPQQTKYPISIKEMFLANQKLMKHLSLVVQNKSTNNHTNNKHQFSSSAFKPYKPIAINPTVTINKSNQSQTSTQHPISEMKLSSHFQPLILPSESHALHHSQENLFSPIDFKFEKKPLISNFIQQKKHWNSTNQINKIQNTQHFNEIKRKSNSLQGSQSFVYNDGERTNNIASIVELITFVVSDNNKSEQIDNRQILAIADFVVSLVSLTPYVFDQAIQQRFSQLTWPQDTLLQLYKLTNQNNSSSSPQSSPHEIDNNVFSYQHTTLPSTGPLVLPRVIQVDSHPSTPSVKTAPSISVSSNSDCKVSVAKSTSKPTVPPILPRKSSNKSSNKSSDIDTPRSMKPKQTKPLLSDKSIKTQPPQQSHMDNPPPTESQDKHPPSKEDISFYESIYPTTILYFPSTQIFCQQLTTQDIDLNTNQKHIREAIGNYFKLNQSIPLKFRQLVKTTDSINKCTVDKSNKKIKRQYQAELEDQQSNLEYLIISQIKLELTIVEYYSINVKPILQHIDLFPNRFTSSREDDAPVIYPLDHKGNPNIQLIKIDVLITCTFSRGAVSSGLLYELLLIYREFIKPVELARAIDSVYSTITKFCSSANLMKARHRLLFILLVWIDGFYCVDFTSDLIQVLWEIVHNRLEANMRNVINLFERSIENAKNTKGNLLAFQFNPLKKGINHAFEFVRSVDVEKCLTTINENIASNHSSKWSLFGPLSNTMVSTASGQTLPFCSNDSFSIVHISADNLALCLTLLQQDMFNDIHPCHYIIYLNNLIGKYEGILERIRSHRFLNNNNNNTMARQSHMHGEILRNLRFSGQLTLWAQAEIKSASDPKLQAKIVKKLVLCCNILLQLNNFASFTSIQEALQSPQLEQMNLWSYVNSKTLKLQKQLLANQSSQQIIDEKQLLLLDTTYHNSNIGSALLSGFPVLPCSQTLLGHLKLSSVGNCLTPNGSLKWNKLKKITEILDRIRLYKQFKYSTSSESLKKMKCKLASRIDHLSGI